GTLTVSAYALSVAANDAGRLYGQANPTFSGSLIGVQPGDNISASYSSTAQTNSPVGSYSIVPALSDPGSRLGNYSVTVSNGTLSVAPAALIGRADDQSRAYSQSNPVFTATYSGFVNGENSSILSGTLNGSTTAGTNSPVGVYPISVSGQSAANYAIQYVDGVLTVGPTPLLVQA